MSTILGNKPESNRVRGWGAVNAFIAEVREEVRELVTRKLTRALEDEVTRMLGRSHHERRDRRSGRRVSERCQKCGSQRRSDFMRNGYRKREPLTQWGPLTVWVPRVRCQCGGSVKMTFSLLGRYQRLGDDLAQQVQWWGEQGMSLRQMQAALADTLQTSVGLRTLNERLHRSLKQPAGEFRSLPPVVMLDGIGMTVLVPNGQFQYDSRGRWRPMKRKTRLVVLVALGVWPTSGAWDVLDWEIVAQEDRANWERFLLRLETRGMYAERGLQLLVHDGDGGLTAALKQLYPYVRRQRCVFHKLRNVWQAITVPETLNTRLARQLKRQVIQQASAIYDAENEAQARERFRLFCEQWQPTQPDAVATLTRDFDDTIAFFALWQRFPHWRPESLRTTSLLERLNRTLRRTFRAANAFHSFIGLASATSRVLAPRYAL